MKKHVVTAAILAAIIASTGCEKPKTVDFEKPLYTINAKGDTTTKWLYDAQGNLIADVADNDTTFYKYNDKNLLIEEIQFGDAITYEYDSKGNLISKCLDSDQESMTYNDKNQITSYSYNSRGKDIINSTYSYDGNKQTENGVLTDYDMSGDEVDVQQDPYINVRFCIDPEFKYDTLELRNCNQKMDFAQYKVVKRWVQINGKYLETYNQELEMQDGEYVSTYTITNEYDQQGRCLKYTYKYGNSDVETTTYTIEGNKVTDSKGNVSYFMEK